ncbi:hypothetical protein QOT17_011806 [Balamuthia mandrillaris]
MDEVEARRLAREERRKRREEELRKEQGTPEGGKQQPERTLSQDVLTSGETLAERKARRRQRVIELEEQAKQREEAAQQEQEQESQHNAELEALEQLQLEEAQQEAKQKAEQRAEERRRKKEQLAREQERAAQKLAASKAAPVDSRFESLLLAKPTWVSAAEEEDTAQDQLLMGSYPHRVPFAEFWAGYFILLPVEERGREEEELSVQEAKKRVKSLVEHLMRVKEEGGWQLDEEQVRFGENKLFFSGKLLVELERMKAKVAKDEMRKVSACIRAWYARQRRSSLRGDRT